MFTINEQLINKYQDVINYNNADTMFRSMERLIEEYGKEFILKREHETEEACVISYNARCAVMRYACDTIEHYAKAILIQHGHTWDESRSWGHNLLELFNNLDDESRDMIISVFKPRNSIKTDYVLDNINIKEDFPDFLHLMDRFGMFDVKKEDASNFYNNYDRYFFESEYQDMMSKLKEIDKILSIPLTEHIIELRDGRTIADELSSLNPPSVPGQPRQQLFGIKARFPGQYLVDGPAEFLISLAYAMNELSKIYRTRNEGNRGR